MTTWFTGSEVRLGLRWIRKQPLMSAVAVLSLAVGIALATTGFTVLEATLWGELPFAGAERFVRLRVYQEPGGSAALDLERWHLFRRRADSFEHLGAIGVERLTLRRADGAVESLDGSLVTPRSLRFVAAEPLLGRALAAGDGAPGAPPVAVVSEGLWRRRFGADPGLVGSSLDLGGELHAVVGVMPDGFEFPAASDVWLPVDDLHLGGSEAGPRSGLQVFGILREGVALATAAAEIESLSARLAAAAPESAPELRVKVVGYTEPPPGWRPMITVLVTVLVLALLVVAANVANLILARTAARTSELAVRTALGAPRSRLVGQLFAEVTLLGVAAAALGLAASQAALGWIDVQLGPEMPFWIEFTPGGATVVFVVAVTLAACAVSGVVPALRATRRDPAAALQTAGAHGGGARFGRFSAAMIVAELALSVALLSGALVVAQGYASYTHRDLGLPRGEVLTARVVEPSAPGATAAADAAALRAALFRAVDALPGVAAWGAASHLPRVDPPLRLTALAPEVGEAAPEPVAAPMAGVTPGYFAALGATPLAGRVFRDQDLRPGAPAVAVVNQPFVDRHFGGRNPIGRRLRLAEPGAGDEGPGPWREIVGVVPDLALTAADPERAAGWYAPLPADAQAYYLALRRAPGGGDPLGLAAPLRRAVADVDPRIDLYRVVPLERVGWEDRAFMAGLSTSLTAMGALALVLSLAGVYAILSFTVTRRTREIGIRLALGARGRQIAATVAGTAALHLALGGVLGTALAFVFMRAGALLVTRLPAGEPWVVPAVLGVLVAAGLAACWLPTRRALGLEPTEALRTE